MKRHDIVSHFFFLFFFATSESVAELGQLHRAVIQMRNQNPIDVFINVSFFEQTLVDQLLSLKNL